jgi:hypothetical protein
VTSTGQRAAAAAARRHLHRADGDRRVGRAIDARHDLATRRGGRAWINGREVTAARSAAQILATSTSRYHTTKQAA